MSQESPHAMNEQVPNLFTQVDQQIASGQPATVLVERSNGTITTAHVAGIEEGHTTAFFADLSEGPKRGMPYKAVPNEKLIDKYQEHLATELAGQALRGSGVEVDADTRPRAEIIPTVDASIETEKEEQSPVDKYTTDFVKENQYFHLFDPSLSDEQREQVIERIKGMDLRSDEQKRAGAEQVANEVFNAQRAAADHRYNQAIKAGATPEEASASADRAFGKTHAELLADELKNVGLQ